MVPLGLARRTLVVLLPLLAASLAPAAAASQREFQREWNEVLHPDPEKTVPFFCVIPRLSLDADVGRARVNQTFGTGLCDWPKVNVTWKASGIGGKGMVSFAFDTEALEPQEAPLPSATLETMQSSEPAPVRLSLLSRVVGALTSGEPEPAKPVPRTGVVVTVSFDVAWDGGCVDARGSFSASVDGEPTRVRVPPDLFRSLCELSLHSDALARDLAGLALSLGKALAPSVPAPGFEPLLSGLATLLAAIPGPGASPAPAAVPTSMPASAPEVPAPPKHEERAAGNATMEALTPASLLGASYDVLLSTPAAQAAASGSFGVAPPPWPAPGPSASSDGAWGPVAAPPAPLPAPPAMPPAAPVLPAASEESPAPSPRDAGGAAAPAASAPQDRRAGPPQAAALVLAAGLAAGLLAALVALHHRLTRDDALRHPGRAALHRACLGLGRPATVSELAGLAGMKRKTAEYHLLQLARLGLLRLDKEPDGPLRFAPPAHPRREAAAPLHEILLARVRATPGLTASELADALGASRLRVDRRAKDLLLAGRLRSRVEDGRRRLYPA